MFIEGNVNVDDSTVRGTLEELLLHHEILDAIPASVFYMTMDLRYRYCNRAFTSFIGKPFEDVVGRTVKETMPLPEQAELYTKRDKEFLDSGKETSSQEGDMLYCDGTFHTVQMIKSLKKDPDGTPKGVVCAFIDLTEQKLVQEKELRYQARLKRLASTLIMSKEKQSAQLAAKLHDIVGQTLALLKLRIQMMNSSMPHSKENSAKQKEILDLIDMIISETRTITFDLGIPVLYQLGLDSSIEWLCTDMKEKYGLNTHYCHISEIPDDLGLEFRSLVFRTIQELLFNVVKHSGVHEACVKIEMNNGKMELFVDDHGIGMDESVKQKKKNDKKGFGLFSSQTMVSSVGGTMSISSLGGTHVHIILPINESCRL